MFTIHNTIINTSTFTGVPLKRWTLSKVVMIQKEPNNPRINRLRVINKYEADLNLVLKFFWPRLTTNHLKSQNLFGEKQWGTWSRRSAKNVSLLDEIINEIHRITCKPLVKLQNDSNACYDKIICNLTTLYSRSFGVSDKVYQLQANSVNNMEYKIQTSLGLSKNICINQKYTTSWTRPRIRSYWDKLGI